MAVLLNPPRDYSTARGTGKRSAGAAAE